jgi:hypothetical protein
VKDGVSAGARNQKLAQVSQDVRKRSLVFRALSVVVLLTVLIVANTVAQPRIRA